MSDTIQAEIDAEFRTFADAYIGAAIESSFDGFTPDGGKPSDGPWNVEDMHPATLKRMEADCRSFLGEWYEHVARDLARAGVEFWVSRCGCGSGFGDCLPRIPEWDTPFEGADVDGNTYPTTGYYLQAQAWACYGEYVLTIGDDALIHGTGDRHMGEERCHKCGAEIRGSGPLCRKCGAEIRGS